MSQHARLGPSNHRWPHCAGSVREEVQYVDIAGPHAIDGTGSHLLLEMCLQNNVSAVQYDQQIIGVNHEDQPNGWLITPDRIKRVQMCLDYITRRVNELKEQFPGCNVSVEAEARSNPGEAFGRDDWWGTCDITITARHPMTGEVYFIEVCDYKDGRMYVSEKNNSQLTAYLFGKMLKHIKIADHMNQGLVDKWPLFRTNTIGGFRMSICQPKTNPVIRYVCTTQPDDNMSMESLIQSVYKLADAAELTDDPNALLTPGKHCRWCKANPKRGGHCTAETDQSLLTVENMSTEIVTTGTEQSLFEYINKAVADPKSLTVEQLGELADAEAGFQAAFDKVKTEIEDRIDQGIAVPGYAKVPGNGSNVYSVSDEVVEKKLKACRLKKGDIYPAKLISPAQVMKLKELTDVQKERLQKEIITHVAGKLTLKQVERTKAVEAGKDADLMFADVPVADDSVPGWVADATLGDATLGDATKGVIDKSIAAASNPETTEEISFF